MSDVDVESRKRERDREEGIQKQNRKIGNTFDNWREDVWFVRREGEGKRGEE